MRAPVRLVRTYPAPSPLLIMQRQAGLHPGGATPRTLSRIASGRGLGRFGSSTLTQGVTGIKTGATTAALTTSIGTGVAGAIGAGAAAGSVVPIIGTAIGALVGLFASGLLSGKKDPEDYNFNQASQMYRQNPDSVLNIANKYLVLAGLFDLQPGQIKGNIPIYKKYGNKGEFRFVNDLAGVIQSAANTGKITANDTPMTVFNNVVMPWINSFGYGPMQDSNGDMINAILLGMTAEYLAGAQTRWFAVGGQYPFGALSPFKLPVAATQASTVSAPPPIYNPVSVPASSLSTPLAPVSATSPAGTTIYGGLNNATLRTPVGIFQFESAVNPQGESRIYSNNQISGAGVQALWDGSIVYLKHKDGSIDRWSTTGWVPYQAAPSASVPVAALPPTSAPTVQVPPGFSAVSGTSGMLPVYVDQTGVYYQLSGSTLSPYSGTLAASGQLIPIVNGIVSQQALVPVPAPGVQTIDPMLYQNTQAGAPVAPYQAPTPAAATPAPTSATAGLSGNTPLWIGGALAVLAVMFATARPAPIPARRARRT